MSAVIAVLVIGIWTASAAATALGVFTPPRTRFPLKTLVIILVVLAAVAFLALLAVREAGPALRVPGCGAEYYPVAPRPGAQPCAAAPARGTP